ncbi:uncharacterized protein VTP21DRAFT_288 [Calcarisporiella thermophila]|uniref:uncharacterized protein n=1 Tax=Calcarisporiella thermophila TaxID=911321 RepID=UPI003742B5F3
MQSRQPHISRQLEALSLDVNRLEEGLNHLKFLAFNSAPSGDLASVRDLDSNTNSSLSNIESESVSKRTQKHCIDRNSLFTGENLHFQLKLRTADELRRLLSAHFAFDRNSHLSVPFLDFSKDQARAKSFRPCTFLNWQSPELLQDDSLYPSPNRGFAINRKLKDYIFHTYFSNCSGYFVYPDKPAFLESYYRGEIEPTLLHTAIADTALHLLMFHEECPMFSQINSMIGGLLYYAQRLLEDAFDSPTIQTTLAFLYMENCMRKLSRFDDSYTYHKQAVLMALALRLDRDNPKERDRVQIEFRRRVWCLLCGNELKLAGVYGKPWLLDLEIIHNSLDAIAAPSDDDADRMYLTWLKSEAEFHYKLAKFSDFDWTQQDYLITQHLISVAAFLQQNIRQVFNIISREDIHARRTIGLCVRQTFWVDWCHMWMQFIESDAPPRRMETEFMQQLRGKAFEEFLRGLYNITLCWQDAIRLQNWCKVYTPSYIFCHLFKFIARTHPSHTARRYIYAQLSQIYQHMKSVLRPSCIAVQVQMTDVANALEEMRPIVFTKEELRATRFRPIAIRKRLEPLN